MVFYESITYKKTSFVDENIQIFKYDIVNEIRLILLYCSTNIIIISIHLKVLLR